MNNNGNHSSSSYYKMKKFNEKLKKSNNAMEIITKLNELKIGNDKSPISQINEFMMYLKKDIEYVLLFKKDNDHLPIFTYEARSDDIIAHGSGSSKKKAKKEAAISFLNKIEMKNNALLSLATINHLSMRKEHTKEISNDKIEFNPIGDLQELCVANGWAFPYYERSNNIQYSQFSCICNVNNYSTEGNGRSKKAAKKQAALLMYNHIINILNDEIDNRCSINKFQCTSKINYKVNTEQNTKYSSSEELEPVDNAYSNLILSDKPWSKKLKDLSIKTLKNENVMELLNHIKHEEDFHVEFREILNEPDEVIILVEISQKMNISEAPTVVYLGTGKTLEEAKKTGAFVALLYLKILLHN